MASVKTLAKQIDAEGKIDLGDLVATVLDAVSRVSPNTRIGGPRIGIGGGGGVTVGMVIPNWPNTGDLRNDEGRVPTELSTFAQNAGTIFERIGDQTSARTLPTTKRAENLTAMQKLGVLADFEVKAISAILAKGDGEAKVDIDQIISDIDDASARATTPTASALLNCILTAAKRQQAAEKMPVARWMSWDWSRAGDGCVEGGGLGAIAGAEIGGPMGAGIGAVIGCVVGGVVKGATGHD